MTGSRFAPADFEVTPERLEWAMRTLGIDEAEVMRQTELWQEHEYKRAYTDFGRCWKRWLRNAEKYGTLRRERKLRLVQEITPDQRQADLVKWAADMQRLGVKV